VSVLEREQHARDERARALRREELSKLRDRLRAEVTRLATDRDFGPLDEIDRLADTVRPDLVSRRIAHGSSRGPLWAIPDGIAIRELLHELVASARRDAEVKDARRLAHLTAKQRELANLEQEFPSAGDTVAD
jgi:hypothetical protein